LTELLVRVKITMKAMDLGGRWPHGKDRIRRWCTLTPTRGRCGLAHQFCGGRRLTGLFIIVIVTVLVVCESMASPPADVVAMRRVLTVAPLVARAVSARLWLPGEGPDGCPRDETFKDTRFTTTGVSRRWRMCDIAKPLVTVSRLRFMRGPLRMGRVWRLCFTISARLREKNSVHFYLRGLRLVYRV
jgi:hypothetical protein